MNNCGREVGTNCFLEIETSSIEKPIWCELSSSSRSETQNQVGGREGSGKEGGQRGKW